MDNDIVLVTREMRDSDLHWMTEFSKSIARIEDRIDAVAARVNALEAGQSPQPDVPNQPDDPEPEPPIIVPTEPGILIDRKFVTQAEIDAFHFVDSMVYPATDPRAAFYDADIGGAHIPILAGEAMSSLRNDSLSVLAPMSGRVYAQWDFYLPKSFYDLNWDELRMSTIKTFRIFNNHKRDIRVDGSGTLTLLLNSGQMWLRNAGRHAVGAHLSVDYIPPPDQWVTHRVTKDYDEMVLEFRATDMQGNVLVDADSDMTYLTPMDNLAPLPHSSGREGAANQNHPTFFGYRNVVLGVE
jgi:hypothetical protein